MISTQIIVSPFIHIFDIMSSFAELEEPKIGISGKGLRIIPFFDTVTSIYIIEKKKKLDWNPG